MIIDGSLFQHEKSMDANTERRRKARAYYPKRRYKQGRATPERFMKQAMSSSVRTVKLIDKVKLGKMGCQEYVGRLEGFP